jgi:hypothetical protein
MNRMVVKRRVFLHVTVLVLQTDHVTETDLEVRDAEGITRRRPMGRPTASLVGRVFVLGFGGAVVQTLECG